MPAPYQQQPPPKRRRSESNSSNSDKASSVEMSFDMEMTTDVITSPPVPSSKTKVPLSSPEHHQSPSVRFSEYGASSVSFSVRDACREREIEAMREEILREKNGRRLDRIQSRQREESAKRRIEFLSEEVDGARALVEEVRSRAEEDLRSLERTHRAALEDLRAADRTVERLREEASSSRQAPPEATLWKHERDMLRDELEAYKDENRKLREAIRSEKESRRRRAMDASTPSSSSPHSSSSSPAPPKIMSELHRTRAELADAKRRARIEVRRAEELEKKNSILRREIERLRTARDDIDKRGTELATLRCEKETFKALEKQWDELRQVLTTGKKSPFNYVIEDNNKFEVDADTSAPTHPPEFATVVRSFRELRGQLADFQRETAEARAESAALRTRVDGHQQEMLEATRSAQDSQRTSAHLEEDLRQAELNLRRATASEEVRRREAEGLRALLDADVPDGCGSSSSSSSSSNRRIKTLEALLMSANEKHGVLEKSLKECRAVSDATREAKRSAETELDQVKEKYGKLREALGKEREKAEKAEERATKAETQSGKGAYNVDDTRVLHLHDNPLMTAVRAKYEKELAGMRERLAQGERGTAVTGASSSKSPTAAASLDVQKATQRLTEKFKENISLFREAVYLLTGYKVDMTNMDSDRPFFKVRSMYSEREEDHLMFAWPRPLSSSLAEAVDSLDLLDTPLAQSLSDTDSFAYMTKFRSVPAFMGSLTLFLFEQQTLAG